MWRTIYQYISGRCDWWAIKLKSFETGAKIGILCTTLKWNNQAKIGIIRQFVPYIYNSQKDTCVLNTHRPYCVLPRDAMRARYMIWPVSACPSIRPSQVGVLSTRLTSSRKQRYYRPKTAWGCESRMSSYNMWNSITRKEIVHVNINKSKVYFTICSDGQ